MEHSAIYQTFKEHSLKDIYDFEQHVKIAEDLEVMGKLPSYFLDGAAHLKAAEYKINIPTLFDVTEFDAPEIKEAV